MPSAATAENPTAVSETTGVSDASVAEDIAQGLIDRGLLGPELAKAPSQASQIPQGAGPVDAAPVASSAEESKEPPVASSPETPEYASLDEYLEKSQLDRGSFLSLPVKAKVDGKELDVPLAKLIESYQIGEHLSHKSNAFAEERRSWEAEQSAAKQSIAQHFQVAEGLANLAHQQLLSEYNSINWQQLEAEDPGRAALLSNKFQAKQAAIVQGLRQVQQTQQQALSQQTQVERTKMLDALPEWRDSTKFKAATEQLSTYATSRGFTPAELSGVLDHRYMLVLHDAARARDLQAQVDTLKAQIEGKTAAALKIVRTAPHVASPGARQQVDPKRVALKETREALRRNPRDEDAQVRRAAALLAAGA